MKKIILSVMFIVSTINISNSQSSLSDTYSCVNPLFETLTNCFNVSDVTGTYRGTGSTLYFKPDEGIQYTQYSPCVDNYNKDRVICPTAPLLVIGSMTKTKKVVQH